MIRTWTPENEAPTPPGGTDYRTVKAWFQRCRDLAMEVDVQKQKIDRIREAAEKMTPSMNGMPGSGGSGDKVGFAVEKMDTEKRALCRMESELYALRIEATRRAYCLRGSERQIKQAECICEFYVNLQSQQCIASIVGLSGGNAVSTYIHDGLAALAEIWEDVQNTQSDRAEI